MILKSLSLGTRTLITALILCTILMASFLLWVIEAPRSLPLLNSYLEYSFNRFGDNYKVSIEKTLLLWDREEKTFDIRSVNMRLVTASETVGAHFPEASLGFSLSSILDGSLAPSSLTVIAPTLRFHTPVHPLTLPELQALYAKIWEKFTSLAHLKKTFPFKTVALKNARLIIDTASTSMLWHINNAALNMKLDKKNPELSLKGNIDFAGEEASVAARATLVKDSAATLVVSVNGLPVHKLLQLLPFSPNRAPLLEHSNTHLVLTANTSLVLNPDGKLQHADFTIDDAYGKVFHPAYMQTPLYPRFLQARGTIASEGKVVTIEKGAIRFSHDTEATFSAELLNLFSPDAEYRLNAEVANFPVNDLGSFWPTPFATKAREWVTSRISGGIASKATGKFIFKPEYFTHKRFPENAINATVHFSGAQLDYLAPLPLIHSVDGVATFTNDHIAITSSRAMMEESIISNARVIVPYIDITGKSITVEGDAKGSVGDIMAFLPVKKLAGHSIPLQLGSIAGDADTHIKLSIPYKPHLTLNDIDINAKSTLKNIRIPGVIPHVDASSGQFLATILSQKLTLKGTMLLNDNPSSLESTLSLKPEDRLAGQSTIRTVLLPKDAESLGKTIDAPLFQEGKIAATIHVNQQKKATTLTADIDAKDAAITWEKFNTHKPIGQNGLLRFTAHIQDSAEIMVPALSYSSSDITAKGRARLGKDFTLRQLELDQLTTPDTALNLHYTEQDNGIPTIVISGKSLDLRSVNFKQLIQKSGKGKGISLTAKFDKILMKNNEVFTHFKAKLECIKKVCVAGSVDSGIGKYNALTLTLKPGKAESALTIQSDNAAALARALNISQNIRSGTLLLNAAIPHNASPHNVIVGTLRIDDFVTINNPILSQILAVITLPGIGLVNILKGDGIAFDRLRAPFTLADGIIILDNAKAYGQVLGITSSGVINLRESTLQLNGIVTPTVYGINNLVSRIPLFGKVLMGGRNQGIIAANYALSGPIDKASLTVNPLSLFTPGFLRKIFE